MWKQPWGYAEGAVICSGLFITGTALQFTTGPVNANLFQYPINLLFGIFYMVCMIVLHLNKKKSAAIRWLSGMEASITSIVAFLVMVLIMGVTAQTPQGATVEEKDFLTNLGFRQLTNSWSFVLIFLYMLTVLLLTTLRKTLKYKTGNIGFLLNHAGLSIALWGATLGSGDLQRLHMVTQTGTPEWRATDSKGNITELPLAIQLEKFSIEEYPPKVMVIDNTTGMTLPSGNPSMLAMENDSLQGRLMDWQLSGTQYLPMAAWVQGKYVPFQNEGATTAVYVKAKQIKTGIVKEGWISYGSFMFPHQALELDNQHSLVMPPLEPKRYVSEVTIFTEDGKSIPATIEVNKPIKVNGWKIYQLSYDETMGKWSRTSTFELVRDPWLPVVYTGITMMLLGAVYLFAFAKIGKKNI
ncbi:cytochrome c biogenesis protein ResB [Macellibacteroides fermentans]|uniref:cytochrome c biogenesis protein ResB n=1 Tax=Macellibacteroides fermentans TaxID=879969 RepID=UPI000B333E28